VGLSDDDKGFYNAEKVLTKGASRGNGYDESMDHDDYEAPHNQMHVPRQQKCGGQNCSALGCTS
jgi:hypothetical protein